jgi:LysM repeat protein
MKRFALLCAALLLTGCDQAFQNLSERRLSEAEKKVADQDFPAAVLLYEAALDGTPKTADVHYKLGLIYDNPLQMPVSALHHYQRYLDLEPEGSHAKEIQKFIQADQLKLGAETGHGATISQEEAKRVKNDNLALRKKVLQLQTDLEAASKARAAMLKAAGKSGDPVFKQEQVQKPLVPGTQTYTVQPGDTLASISRKFYKNNSARWKDIQDANFNALEGTAKLKPGMVLMIP